MTLVGDSRAYAFLKKHGPLINELPNRSIILTVHGRVWVLTFLLFHDYLSKDLFNDIAKFFEQNPGRAAFETGKKLRETCERWLKDNGKLIVNYPKQIVPPTDLNYGQVSLLLNLLVAAQENLERAAAGRKVQ